MPTVLPVYTAEMEHDGRKYSVSLSDFHVLRCENCGKLVLDDAADKRLDDALRAKVGLLFPADIREQRTSLNLSQNDLAGLLGISVFTLSRWESGAQIQQRCMDKFLKTFFDVKEAREYLAAGECSRPTPSKPADVVW
jgi:putative zinc finger/helix-turn-helix YgiT family protein